jgi:hypothetical protein
VEIQIYTIHIKAPGQARVRGNESVIFTINILFRNGTKKQGWVRDWEGRGL